MGGCRDSSVSNASSAKYEENPLHFNLLSLITPLIFLNEDTFMSIKCGKVEAYLHEKLKSDGVVHLTLVDPEDLMIEPENLKDVVRNAEKAGTDAFMVGGSLGIAHSDSFRVIKTIKETTTLPVIIFPGNVDGVLRSADAIFFLSLLNSRNPYWISGAQALGAPLIRRMGMEAIPTAYLVVEPGGSVSFIGDAKPIPKDKPDIAAAYALAGEFLGMRLIFLEAGSGAKVPVPDSMISTVKKAVTVPIVTGGGIKEADVAAQKVAAGADIIATGTLISEAKDLGEKLATVIKAVKEEGKKRLAKDSGA